MSLREYHRPADRESAATLLRRKHTNTKAIYLGPSPIALHEHNWEAAVDLSRLGLSFIKRDAKAGLRIGALTSLQDIVDSVDLQAYSNGLLSCAAGMAAHHGLRNAANIGGVLTTSRGAPEVRLALMVLAAETISTHGFITEVRLPKQTMLTSLQRVARTPMDHAIVAVTIGLQQDDNVITQARIAVHGISDTPILLEDAGSILTSQTLTSDLIDGAATAAMRAADPAYYDYRGSATYRSNMASILTRRAIEAAWQRKGNE